MDDQVNENNLLEKIIEGLENGSKGHNIAMQLFMEKFIFYDKSLANWLDDMAIKIPKNATPQDLREIFLDIAFKQQRAANFYSIASTTYEAIIHGEEIKKHDIVNKLVNDYAKANRTRPAGKIIEQMADSCLSQIANNRVVAKIIRDFWKERKDVLVELRKNTEQASISLHTEMKYLEGQT